MTEKEKIRSSAVKLAKQIGIINLSRQEVCDLAGVKDGSFPAIMECTFADLLHDIQKEVPLFIESVGITKKRIDPTIRRDLILHRVLDMSEEHGYRQVTRPMIADRLGISERLITHHFGTMKQFQRDLVRAALQARRLKVIGQAIAAGDSHVKDIDPILRAEALSSL